MLRQGIRWLLVITSLAVGGLISLKHPLGGAFALVCFAGMVAATFWHPTIFLTALLALAAHHRLCHPWSGWLTFEELDLALLAFAAGGYAQWAMNVRERERLWRWPGPVLMLSPAFFQCPAGFHGARICRCGRVRVWLGSGL